MGKEKLKLLAAKEVTRVIEPYGGKLVDLLVPANEVPELIRYANDLPSIRLSQRVVHDLELLAVGAFSPLDRLCPRLITGVYWMRCG